MALRRERFQDSLCVTCGGGAGYKWEGVGEGSSGETCAHSLPQVVFLDLFIQRC